MRTMLPAAILSLGAALSAQNWIETFSFPDGALPPASGWTVQSGTWQVKNQKMITTTTVWGYVTKDGISAFNCVVEADCKWNVPAVQFAGAAARHAGTAADDAVMCKIQSNGATVQGYDTAWCYERPGSATAITGIAPPLTSVRVRLVVLNNTATMSIDTDGNGTFDRVVPVKTLTAHAGPGLVGITGYTQAAAAANPSEIDNFAYYAGVLVERAGSLPKVGTSYQMDFYAPVTQPTPFMGAASLTSGTIPIGGNRGIPLAIDPLLTLSLSAGGALGLVGMTDATGKAAPTFNIPNIPSLVGLDIFTSVFALDPQQPLGIGAISNNHYFKIQS